MKPELLPVDCPICHEAIRDGFRDHLLQHEKAELVEQILADVEADHEGE